MELDVNIAAHDLLWRRMSLTTKKAYVQGYGAGRAALVENEVQRLVESGYAIRSDTDFDLTPAGKELLRKMTMVCKKSE